MKGYQHQVSLLVSAPRSEREVDEQFIEQARPWFGPGVELAVSGARVVEVAQRDRRDRPIAWRVVGLVTPVSQRPRVVALSDRLAG